MGEVHVLISPEAGRGRAAADAESILGRISSLGATPIDITGANAAETEANAHAAVDGDAERLVVVGGDGLVHMALQAVAGTPTILGVVPVGTGNDFARAIAGIPNDPLEATTAALGDASPLDAIGVGARWVASVATAGFSGDVNARANQLSRPRGQSRYSVATMLELPRLRLRQTRLVVDVVVYEYEAALVAVANTAWFGGGMNICPEAKPDDGMLDVTVVADVGRIELLRFFGRVFNGTHVNHPKVHTHRARVVELGGEDVAVWGDGEPMPPGQAVLRAEPGALNLARTADSGVLSITTD